MKSRWPADGPWIIASTSADIDWRIAAAALASASREPVAAVIVGDTLADDEPARLLRSRLTGLLELPTADGLPLAHVRGLVYSLTHVYSVVLVAAPAGLLIPVGRGGWTLANLAAGVGAPAVIVTGAGPEERNLTTLALGALAGYGIPAALVTIGEVDEETLPVTPAGRIPDAADAQFDPVPEAADEPAPPVADPPAARGKRVLFGLLAVFVVLAAVAWGLSLSWGAGNHIEPDYQADIHVRPLTPQVGIHAYQTFTPWPVADPPAKPVPRRSRGDVCPQNAGGVTVTHPGPAITARVNAAWARIEKWLAAHAPATAKSLMKPASTTRTDELQRRMSVAFPPDLVASLHRHDGVSTLAGFTLPPYYVPESLDEIFSDWAVTCSVLADATTDWSADWWNKAFVPFAADGTGQILFVDQRPTGHGRVGRFDPEDSSRFGLWPASTVDLLEDIARSMETGQPYDGEYRPSADGKGALYWAAR